MNMKTMLQTGAAVLLAVLSIHIQAAEQAVKRAPNGYDMIDNFLVPWQFGCDLPTGEYYDFHGKHRTLHAGDSIAWTCKNRVGVVGLAHASDGQHVRVEFEMQAYYADTSEADAIKDLHESCDKVHGVFQRPTPGHFFCDTNLGTLDIALTTWEKGEHRMDVEMDIIGTGVWK